jgi:hypothetical protein
MGVALPRMIVGKGSIAQMGGYVIVRKRNGDFQDNVTVYQDNTGELLIRNLSCHPESELYYQRDINPELGFVFLEKKKDGACSQRMIWNYRSDKIWDTWDRSVNRIGRSLSTLEIQIAIPEKNKEVQEVYSIICKQGGNGTLRRNTISIEGNQETYREEIVYFSLINIEWRLTEHGIYMTSDSAFGGEGVRRKLAEKGEDGSWECLEEPIEVADRTEIELLGNTESRLWMEWYEKLNFIELG